MSYPGGKAGAGVYQTLINLMPPHDVYIEPFLGGGAIMRTKRPAAVNIGIDIDRTALEVATMPAGSPWQAMRPGHSGSEVFAPAPVAVFGDGWKRFEFHQEDSIDFLRHIELRPSALVYADPPYLRSTR